MKRKNTGILPEDSILLGNTKFPKSFNHIEGIKPWEEIVGKLNDFSIDEDDIFLQIDDHVIIFNVHSKEASCITKLLDEYFLGKFVAILKTDIPEKPVIIRLVYCY